MLIEGDCLIKLKELPDNSADELVTDPPYGIEFMGKDWDSALPSINIWKEVYRVLKPGAFGFICCIPRQDCLSRMIISLEDAGFNINFSSIYWTYATGFPKALNISKAIDKRLGKFDDREVVGKNPHIAHGTKRDVLKGLDITKENAGIITAPNSNEAKQMEGSYGGFQPKPAVEVIIVVMKPLSEKSYIDQALKDGKGVVWFDDCRIPYKDSNDTTVAGNRTANFGDEETIKGGNDSPEFEMNKSGRFPANLLISDNILDDFSKFYSLDAWAEKNLPFLIVPKASKKEKDLGLSGPIKEIDKRTDIGKGSMVEKGLQPGKNTHPTVKPLKLKSYLITLGSRPGDTILDPFCGSATTGCAAIKLNRKYIMIEKEAEYIEIAKARLEYFKRLPMTI